jgi:predicted lipoprotein with Yx(FWY)xxD motif
MRNLVPAALLCLLACACGGHSDAPGIVIGDDGDGAASPDGDEPGDVGDGDGDTQVDPDEDAGEQPEPGDGDGDDESQGEVPGANLRFTESEQFGKYLSDAAGRALYMRRDDVAVADSSLLKTTCIGDCSDEWPPYDAENVIAGRGISEQDIVRFHRTDGTWQLAFKGHPLHYRADDEGTTDISGDSIDENGTFKGDGQAHWYVARDYEVFFYSKVDVRPYGTAIANKPFLTDGLGRTLYVYLSDTPGNGGSQPVSTCTSTDCLTKWPVWSVNVGEDMVVPSNLSAADFGTFMRDDGSEQTTYRGWPIYQFAADDTPGETSGDNQGKWHVFEPNLITSTPAAP